MLKRLSIWAVIALLLAIFALPVHARQDQAAVTVSDQVSLDGTVTIDMVHSPTPGFIVIHADGGGSPGPVIGYRAVNAGDTYALQVTIDPLAATPTLFAMLHQDTGEAGVYEFGTVEGADGPVTVDGAPVTPPFNVNLIDAQDQIVDGAQVTLPSVVAQQDGWLVIHADADGGPGPVLGQAQVTAGANADVTVDLSSEATSTLWPMLHVDTGEIGTYEFGTVDGADGPVAVNGQVAVTPLRTVPHVRVDGQVLLFGDEMDMMMDSGAPMLVAKSVLADTAGWLVVHADADGAPGPVLGYTAVPAGLSTDVAVELDANALTPVVWPMLHVDTGAAGTYEFGTVEGADGPVSVDGSVLTFPVNVAPSLTLEDQTLDGSTLVIKQALIGGPGWIAVHSSQDGAPGPVIASYPLPEGLSTNIHIDVDPAQAGSQVFPMLHHDTGEMGVYEFGTVEGADGPISVGGSVVVGPLNLSGDAGMEMDASATEAADMDAMATEDAASMDSGATSALDGDALVSERCTVCHSRERIDNAVKDQAGWESTVDRMIGYGAQLTPEERQAVIDYLSNR
ncbi:DUF7282 domain-containing protein [Aggregatilinea lenta]|uniref:DUF7282 domain-containing protein n=1 Tax=Aggregatilinea lenta TaxID=913108 RepID=UPI000E5B3575|nr:hypothetical protein [Aggregatilinea lenta]